MFAPAFLSGIPAAAAGLAAFGLGAALAVLWQRRLAAWPHGQAPRGLFAYGAATERRAWCRRKGSRVRIQLTSGDGATASGDGATALGDGWVIDRSTGGLCVQFASAIPPRTHLNVRPVHATSAMPWVPVEVKSCRPRADGWESAAASSAAPPGMCCCILAEGHVSCSLSA